MQTQRQKNAVRNSIVGFLLTVYQMIMPFVLRTIMIYTLGMKYVGLNSLFTSILQVLNLAELGVGSAMIYSMYKPIVEEDKEKICKLMNLYKKYYRIIGLIILIIGVTIIPFIPNFISGEIPEDINVYVLYILNLFATVLSYWLFAYKNSLLTAHQRVDIIDKINIFILSIQYILQGIALLIFGNYYLYIIIVLIAQVLLNIVTAIVAKRMYPNYYAKGKLEKNEINKINKKIKDLFTSKVGATVVNSVDTIVISTFLGLTVLATYNNYYYIMSSVVSIIIILFKATTAGIGNSLITETKEKNLRDLNNFSFIIYWIGCFCSCSLLCLYQPFVEIWAGEQYLLPLGCVICLVLCFYVKIITQVLIVYKDASGMWHEDRWRPLITAIINLALNISTVKFFGLYGVILSTVISMTFVGLTWLIKNVFGVIFKTSPKKYVITLLKHIICTIICCIMTILLGNIYKGNVMYSLVYRAIICIIIPNLFYMVVFYKKNEFKYTMQILDNVIGSKIKPLHKIFEKIIV